MSGRLQRLCHIENNGPGGDNSMDAYLLPMKFAHAGLVQLECWPIRFVPQFPIGKPQGSLDVPKSKVAMYLK